MTRTLVIGGTGTMGTPVVAALAARRDSQIVVLTRDPRSERARSLLAQSSGQVQLVAGDVTDESALAAALRDCDEVFANTDFFSTPSAVGEYETGLMILRAAERAQVDRFLWSSLDYAGLLTDGAVQVPHYDAKAAVQSFIALRQSEEMLRQDPDGWYTSHVATLVTAPYFENFFTGMAPSWGKLTDGRTGFTFDIPLSDGRYPLIALEDIATFASIMLNDWTRWRGRTLRVAAEGLTGKQIAEQFEQVTGLPSEYRSQLPERIPAYMPDLAHDVMAMFEFFQRYDVVGQGRELPLLRSLHPGLISFETWLGQAAPRFREAIPLAPRRRPG